MPSTSQSRRSPGRRSDERAGYPPDLAGVQCCAAAGSRSGPGSGNNPAPGRTAAATGFAGGLHPWGYWHRHHDVALDPAARRGVRCALGTARHFRSVFWRHSDGCRHGDDRSVSAGPRWRGGMDRGCSDPGLGPNWHRLATVAPAIARPHWLARTLCARPGGASGDVGPDADLALGDRAERAGHHRAARPVPASVADSCAGCSAFPPMRTPGQRARAAGERSAISQSVRQQPRRHAGHRPRQRRHCCRESRSVGILRLDAGPTGGHEHRPDQYVTAVSDSRGNAPGDNAAAQEL